MKETTNWLKLTPVEKNYIRLDPYRMFMSSSKSSHFRLKMFLLAILLPALLFAQVKPTAPVLQPGWSTSCVRALPLHEGSGTTPTDLTGNSTPAMTADSWGSDAEGPYFDSFAAIIDIDAGLPGAGVSQYTWYMRILWNADGAGGTQASTFTNGPPSQGDVTWYENVSSTDAMNFSVRNATNCAECVGTVEMVGTPATKHNLIGEYDGDSLRVYDNNVRSCAIKLTNGGNLLNSGYTTRLGSGHDHASDGCNGSTGWQSGVLKLYTTVIWTRLLTPTERAQIQSNPYVMFQAGGGGGRRKIIQ